uniref:Integrase catalytic domain-containing protein n=1 Tax=Amphilophus citrinellus TaxID=61819 RepID=A0A3Q0SJX4_AMPCI
LLADIKPYVASYSICQLTKPSQRKPAGLMVPISPPKPWQYTGVDFWNEVCAVREATAQASKFVNRGSPFVSELFNHVLSTLGSMLWITAAYHPQTNAMERMNKTLNGTRHGISFFRISLETPLDLITQPSSSEVDESLRATLQQSQNDARIALAQSRKRQKHYYDLRHCQATYAVGDLVKIKSRPKSDVQANVLYTGPLYVTQKLGDSNYRLTRLDTGEYAGVFHVVNMQSLDSFLCQARVFGCEYVVMLNDATRWCFLLVVY